MYDIGRINVVCEGFVITENHDAYTFILESLFQMSSTRSKENVHAIYVDEFMTQNILDSIGMKNTRIFYDHFHLKLNLEKALISKWNVLSPIINSMFIAKNEVILNSLFEQIKTLCGHLNNYVLIIFQFMDKKKYWESFIIDKVKGTFRKLRSSHSESNHSSVNNFAIRNFDGIHGAMKELMNRQKCLMLKNNHETAQQYMELQVINQDFKAMRIEIGYFLFNASSFLC